MVRAFSTLGCPELSLRDTVSLAHRHHIDVLELRALGDSINLPAYFASEYGTTEAFGAAVREMPVRIAALDTSLHLADANAAEREQFLAFVPWAEAAGIPWLRVFDGGAKLGERAAISAAANTTKWWREVRSASGFNVDIMVETHNRLLTTAAIQRFLLAAPDTALLWDAHHTWKLGGESPASTWQAIGRHVVHIHVKDSVSAPIPHHPYKYVLPGTGEFPMPALGRALAADHFQGPLSLEWEKLWHPDLPLLDEALRIATTTHWW